MLNVVFLDYIISFFVKLYSFFVFFSLFNNKYIKYGFYYKVTVFIVFFLFFLLFFKLYIGSGPICICFYFFKKFDFIFIKPFFFYIDTLSLKFLIVILTISIFTIFFQDTYLSFFLHKERFLKQLNFFILSMLLFVLSKNWVLLLFFWECLGISSFFLIGFFKNKTSVFKSAFKAFIFNKISDFSLMLACALYFKIFNDFTICPNFFFFRNFKNSFFFKPFLFFLFLSSMVKSAQFFFFFWLPDSMEAPIPASALIHSATLVSAGIYLYLRFFNFFFLSKHFFLINLIFICSSMLLFSLISLTQTDVKKILAFSTISNCSFIYLLIFLKEFELSIFFFSMHGFLKSLCFLMFGMLIIHNNHTQDLKIWNKFNLGFNFTSSLFCFLILFLGSFPGTLVYEVKSKLKVFPFFNLNTTYVLTLTLFFYSMFSYLYSLKVFFINSYLFKKKKNCEFVDYFNFKNTIQVCFFYTLTILLYFLYFQNKIFLKNTSCFNLVLLFFLPTILIFFFFNKKIIFFNLFFWYFFFIFINFLN